MTHDARLSAAESAVLEASLPAGLKPDMKDVALCLFEVLVLDDGRAGDPRPAADWLAELQRLAKLAVAQLDHLAQQKGGQNFYLGKNVGVYFSARDEQMCRKFRGDYRVLALEFGLTEMRVRQIVDAWQREQYAQRQGRLLGLDPEGPKI